MANNLVDQTGVGADVNKVDPQEGNKGMVPGPTDAETGGLSIEERKQARLAGSNYPHPTRDNPATTRSQAGRPNQSQEVIDKAVENGQSSGIPDASGIIHRTSSNIGAGGTPTAETDPDLDRKPGINQSNT